MTSIYETDAYRDFIVAMLAQEPYVKGGRTRLAEHLGVHVSLISTVLAGRQGFSAEHGMRIAEFFGLDEEESEWLVLLIHLDRAGSESLRRLHRKQLDRKRADRKKIQAQIKAKAQVELGESDLAEYYGAWHVVAAHMCIRNPDLRDPDSVAKALRLERAQALRSLKTLERLGFARALKGKWIPTEARFHVGRFSPALRSHLGNWRARAVNALDEFTEENLHYSLVVSVDDPAAARIRALLLELIKDVEPVIASARDERVLALNLDFFGISRR